MANDITVSGDGLKNGFINHPNLVKIDLGGLNVSHLIVDMDGPEKPQCLITTGKNGMLECRYTTGTEGTYSMSVTFDEEHIEGSPFEIAVEGEFIIDTSKVKVAGAGLKEGRNRQNNDVTVDARAADIPLPLQYKMEGTSKPDLSFRNNPNGTSTLSYKPYTTGLYKLHLKYGDTDVPGSPFQIRVK